MGANIVHTIGLRAGFLDISFYKAEYTLSYLPKEKGSLFYSLGASLSRTNYEVDTQTIEMASNTLKAGLGFLF
jgi:hypothetical protein